MEAMRTVRHYVQRIEGYRPKGQPSSGVFALGLFLFSIAILGAIPLAVNYFTDNPRTVLLIGGAGGILMVTAYTMAYLAMR